ncbi:DUF4148 domain-containing protein [Paraburkholderia metrosideri]|uniref:DUF4148 domain-containing protein n=1 Tax=Paraburkholderia metrosideri TaxID=580937 RepID=A0ABM8NKW5_9BURK|nr:DUF4148 domain-containing protein [Paraburkholderia metrosideri]CAD6530785.1 hypothetical protein LMG28140_02399 [Paraburkholderia metrosideri]
MKRIAMRLLPALTVAALLSVGTSSAFAQASTTPATGAAASSPTSKSAARAQRKTARKEARAKKNAELKKLEDAGVNPATRDDENYSKDLQNAEKKAGAVRGASQ